MDQENFTEDLTEARVEYFRAADAALEKIRLRFGTGREGFLNFLNNKDVENFSEKEPEKN